MPWTFHTPTCLRFGEGVAGGLADELAALGARAPLLVSDPGVERAGLIERVLAPVRAAGFAPTVFARVEPNPTAETIHAGLDAARAAGCDAVVSLGGGSAIDAGKAMAILHANPGDVRGYEYGKAPLARAGLPFITIPTTAGTGSEVTWWSVVTDRATRRKFDVGSPLMAARTALVDPELTFGLPPAVTAATGMDALTHAIEALATRNASPHTSALALEAATLLERHLPGAVRGEREARRWTMLGATTAGLAFPNAGLGAVHGLTAPIGGHLDLPHGQLNAALLPAVMVYNLPAATPAYARLALAWGLAGADARSLAAAAIARVRALNRELGNPTLRALGVPAELVPTLAREGVAPPTNCASNPVPVDAAAAERILRAALEE